MTVPIYTIDLQELGFAHRTAVYLIATEEPALIDCGPSPCLPVLLAEIKKLGFDPADVTKVLLTHTHPDHSGSAGHLAGLMPRAQFYLNRRSTRLLTEPAFLIANTRNLWGDFTDKWFGEIRPLPASRLEGLTDGDVITLAADFSLTAMATPGHTTSHFSFYAPERKALFAGEALGIYFPDLSRIWQSEILLPSTPTPDFHLEKAATSLKKLAGLVIDTIYFAHFGANPHGHRVLERALGQLLFWADLFTGLIMENKNKDYLANTILAYYLDRLGPVPAAAADNRLQKRLMMVIKASIDGFFGYLAYLNRQAQKS